MQLRPPRFVKLLCCILENPTISMSSLPPPSSLCLLTSSLISCDCDSPPAIAGTSLRPADRNSNILPRGNGIRSLYTILRNCEHLNPSSLYTVPTASAFARLTVRSIRQTAHGSSTVICLPPVSSSPRYLFAHVERDGNPPVSRRNLRKYSPTPFRAASYLFGDGNRLGSFRFFISCANRQWRSQYSSSDPDHRPPPAI